MQQLLNPLNSIKENPMARQNYSFEKRQRELAKKKKKEEKRQKKAVEADVKPQDVTIPSAVHSAS